MKRAYVLFLAFLLILTGCKSEDKTNNVSVKDVCCPYEIYHTEDGVDITLQDGEKSGIHWSVEAIPTDICQVSSVSVDEAYTSKYHIAGKEVGAAQLTFTALKDDTALFTLTVVVDVDGNGKAAVSSYRHWERAGAAVDADGLQYKWYVDASGILNFSFLNEEDLWNVSGDGAGICTMLESMSTPVGCKFSAQAKTSGQTTVLLIGETTQRKIGVKIQVTDDSKLEVISVQEQ